MTTKIWLLTLTALMPDGRHLTTHDTYATESYCLAAGMITSDRLQNTGNPTGFRCDQISLENLDIKSLVSPEDFELMVNQDKVRQQAPVMPSNTPSSDLPAAELTPGPTTAPTAANR